MTMHDAPIWVRAASTVIRRLPAGRYRAMNWVARRRVDPFWMQLPADLGSLTYACDLRDGLMREVCLTGRYEPQETALLRHLLRPGMTFVDVGANWGYFTLVGAHLVGSTGRVLSIEADPRACRALHANLAKNHIASTVVRNIAASDGPGRLRFREYEPQARDTGNFGVAQTTLLAEHGRHVEIDAAALDDVLDREQIDRVHLLKMDIEGGEAKAVAGLARRLASHRIDAISMELHPHHLRDLGTSAAAVIAELRRHGYVPWRIDHSRDAHRAAASTDVDASQMLAPLDSAADLGAWPHVLWTLTTRV
jgi:FkbM family methyltransferase